MPSLTETILPTEQDAQSAREFSAVMDSQILEIGAVSLHFRGPNNGETDLKLPSSVVRLVMGIMQEMGKGNGVAITPIHKEMTTQKAADFLMVSRPYLIEELLEKGKIPYRKVGNRRRIRTEDLLRYRQAEDAEMARREAVMQELIAETERLGLYE